MGGTAVPKKLYYRIGEACKAVDIQPYVLRYWETEFDALAPGKSKSGQRVYSEEELGIIRRIKELLYEEGYTIAGAKKRLQAEREDGRAFAAPEVDGELFEGEEGSAADDVPVIAVEPAMRGAEMAPEELEPVPPASGVEESAVDDGVAAPAARAARGKRRTKSSPHTRRSKETAEATEEPASAGVESAVVDLLPRGVQSGEIAAGSVDSALSERVETLEHGLRRVLSEVRHLRDLLAGSSDDR